jgi:hypothetical protein
MTGPADEPVYKVSYVVRGADHPGMIMNTRRRPAPGDPVDLGRRRFRVVEVLDLLPARGGFVFLHVTLEPAD